MTRPFPPADYYLPDYLEELRDLWEVSDGVREDLEHACNYDEEALNEDERTLVFDIGQLLQSIEDVQVAVKRIQRKAQE